MYPLSHYNCQCLKTVHVHMNVLFSLWESHDYTHVQPCSNTSTCTTPPFVNHMTIPMYSHVQIPVHVLLLPLWITWLYPCTAMFNTRLPSSLRESHDHTHVHCTAMWEHPTWMESLQSCDSIPNIPPNSLLIGHSMNYTYTPLSKCRPILDIHMCIMCLTQSM